MKYTLIQDNQEIGTYNTILECLKIVSSEDFYIITKPSNNPQEWYGIQLSTFISIWDDNNCRIPWIGESCV
jgi:hypothetical protein